MAGSDSTLSRSTYKVSTGNGSGKDRTIWLGPRERQVLSRILELGLRIFKPSDLGLDIDRRRLNDILRRLVRKGILAKIARGLYQVVADLRKVLALPTRNINGMKTEVAAKDSDGTRAAAARDGVGDGVVYPKRVVYVEGPFLDNLDGYTVSGRRVRGDRGRDRDLSELAFFSRVSYAEILYRVEGVEIFGALVIYQRNNKVRIEWRPPRGFIKRNGVASGLRMYWEMLLAAFKAILHTILKDGPLDVKQRMLRIMVGAGLKQLICV
ncbi:MAG: hypothetical protein DRH17_13620 [Deltaproteobacteria bacterium]|nr:MAG: hypothetical protein DRH17_13620 [Deltaproteobacteria bacterium]